MEKIESRVYALEVKTDESQKNIAALQEKIRDKTDENAVKVLIDDYLKKNKNLTEENLDTIVEQTLKDKKYLTQSEVKELVKETQLNVIKWTIGTTISVGAIILAAIRVILMA
ncbi:hypothetical protein [Bacillus alkalicellulosilyticus]|uniref:hypothetical protein n=1 Tax=Alkalihalobacterium alkalicellulosilyticum TaxID=1912214 RepID=UPI000998D4E4|nr:hypothetical protein [Bacillus alkalicellulosilyticus]